MKLPKIAFSKDAAETWTNTLNHLVGLTAQVSWTDGNLEDVLLFGASTDDAGEIGIAYYTLDEDFEPIRDEIRFAVWNRLTELTIH